jgi:transposase
MEACATRARELTKLGHEVRLMPAKDVNAYVKRNKNDAAEAEAICEAVRRPTMRFVAVKSAEQQARLMQHRARDLLIRQRTQLVNALRAHLAELGIAAAQGREGIKELLAIVAQDGDTRLPVDAHASLMVLAAQLQAVQTMIGSMKRIVAQHRVSDESKRLRTIPGIGVIGATTIAAVVPDPKVFRSGRDFCGVDRHRAAARFNWRQAQARADLETGRSLLASHLGRWGLCRLVACAPAAGEVSMADTTSRPATVQSRRGRTCQQDGAHRLGVAGQGWDLPGASTHGSVRTGSAMGR